VNSIHFTVDGSRFVTASNDRTARVWDYKDRALFTSLEGHHGSVTSAAFSRDGSSVVTSSRDKFVRFWDIRSSTPPQTFGPASFPATRAVFHPNGQIIGFGTDYGSFQLVDTRNQKVLQTYERVHYGPITSLQFHPSGLFALTTSTDKKICIWDLTEGELLYTIRKHDAGILDAQWNREGSEFLSCDKGGNLRHWLANFQKKAEYASLAEVQLRDAVNNVGGWEDPDAAAREAFTRATAFVDSRFQGMLYQLDLIGKTMAMMNQRMGLIDRKVSGFQETTL
jgi:WD40 repeat protein